MRTLDDVIAGMPAERRVRVNARGRELIAEERALQHLRKARHFTQASLAEALGIDQAGVCKLEKRSDMMLSTLRSYVEAMGGELHLTATFPDGAAEIVSFKDVAGDAPKRAEGSGVRTARRSPALAVV